MVDAAAHLKLLAKGAFGPNGVCVALRANERSGAGVVSAVGGRILDDIVDDPIGRLVLKNTAAAQHASHGDGSLASTLFACSLIHRTTKRALLSPATRVTTIGTFQLCLDWCMEHLQLRTMHSTVSPTLGMPLSVGHLPSMLALLRAILSPKVLAASDSNAVDGIALQLMQAFIMTCPTEKTTLDYLLADINSGIRIHKVVGAANELSRCVEGIIIDTPVPIGPSDEQQLGYVSGGNVLIFKASLDLELKHPSGHSFKSGGTLRAPRAEHERFLATIVVNACKILEVKVVISQRVINRHIQEQLIKAGVLPLERISGRYIDAVVRLTGAWPLGTWYHLLQNFSAVKSTNSKYDELCASAWGKSVGICGAVDTIHLGGKRFTHICPPEILHTGTGRSVVKEDLPKRGKPRNVATLVLCAPTELEMKDLDAVVQAAIKVKHLSNNLRRTCTISSLPGTACAKRASDELRAILEHSVRRFFLRRNVPST